jgi:4-hydroxybenzoate polyprenyltransferase
VPARDPTWRDYAKQLRLHQWLKNALLFVPLLASQKFTDSGAIAASIAAFVAFGLCASSVYVLNDLMDLPADRRHPRKKDRPFASARIPVEHGVVLIPGLLIAGFLLALFLPWAFVGVLALYYFVTLNYNLWAKNIAVLDTLVLAGLYTLRIIAGAAAISVVPSFWLLAFSMFFFLSVAMAKRYSELVNTDLGDDDTIPGRQYRRIDLSTIMSEGAASGYAAVIILALYINSDEVAANYSHPEVIWLTCPLLLYWVNKLWLNTQRKEMTDDPLVWALENRVSRGIAVMCTLLLVIAI